MELFKKPNIDFMGKKWLWIGISLSLIVLAIFQISIKGINQGVEFTGGAEVILRFVENPRLEDIRDQLERAGIPSASVTTFGESGGSEVVIRAGLGEQKAGGEGDMAVRITESLMPPDARQKIAQGLINLNTADSVTMADFLVRQAGLPQDQATTAAEAIGTFRRTNGGVITIDQAQGIPGLPPAGKEWIKAHAFAGPFGLRGQDVIEATVSKEMRTQAIMATLGALGGMLIYLWFRFQFQWGLGAVVALAHDTIITLGFFSLAGFEANLPVVAAFLTLIGYSVNDTIVIFDRIRETMRSRGSAHLESVINESINNTLSRTIITSLLTFMSAAALFFFGGPVLKPLSFVLVIGIIIGTYSSIYIASPIIVVWQKYFGKKIEEKKLAKARA